MKLALLSDIHANIQALDACLNDAKRQGVQQFAFLGDLVGYGADPAAVVERIMQYASEGAIVIKGNHDAFAITPPALPQDGKPSNPVHDSARWTHATLSAEHKTFLAALPMNHIVEHTYLVHASARNPESWPYVEDESSATRCLDAALVHDTQVRHVFCGHVHHQRLYFRGKDGNMLRHQPTAGMAMPVPTHRYWVSTIGSVGQPRDGKALAAYVIFDTQQHTLQFQRVPFDYITAAQSILSAGLPKIFADRLYTGM